MRINKKKQKKELPLTLAPKFQFGGFPSFGDIDFSDYGDVEANLRDNAAFGDTYSRAFNTDNPDLIGEGFMYGMSRQQAFQNNPLQTAEDFKGVGVEQLAEEAAKRRTLFGIGKKKAKRKAEEQFTGILNNQNQQITAENNAAIPGNLTGFQDQYGQANQFLGFLDLLQFQQGGVPPRITENPVPIPNSEALGTYYEDDGLHIIPRYTPMDMPRQSPDWSPNGDISEQPPQMSMEAISSFKNQILNLKNTREDKRKLGSAMQFFGITSGTSPQEVNKSVKQWKKFIGIKDKSAKLSEEFLNKAADSLSGDLMHLYGHVRSFQQGGSLSQLGYSDGSPYQNMPAIPIQGNTLTMSQTGRPLMAYPNVGQPKLMQPYSGTHIFPGASQVTEMPIMQQGGLINTNILTEKGDPWEYQKVNGVWKTRKKGNKTWITPTGRPLAAIEERYDPDARLNFQGRRYTVRPTDPNTPVEQAASQINDEWVDVQDGISYNPGGTMPPPPNTFQGRRFAVRDIPQQSDVPMLSMDPRTIAAQEPVINQTNLPYGPNNPLVNYGVTDEFGNATAGSSDMMSAQMAALLYPGMIGIPGAQNFIHPAVSPAINWVGRAGSKTGKVGKAVNNYNKLFKEGGKKKLYQEGGVGAVGAQLEVGELFASTNADIFDTAATEKHSKMKKDKVTDVLAEGDYVFSALPRMKMTRKEAEDMSFGMGGVLYKEGEIPEMPVEMTAADLFKEDEKEVKLTDYVERIRKKYVIKDSDDVFDKKTNDFNRQSRGMYLSGAAVINEKKKKGEKSVGYASTFENPFASDITSTANELNSGTSDARAAAPQMDPNEFQQGGLNPLGIAMNAIPFLGGIIQGFGALGSARNNRRDIQNTLLQDRRDINQVAGSQSQYQGLSTAAALAALGLQDPNVTGPSYNTHELDASIRRVPRSLFDYQSARLAASTKPYMDQAFNNSGSFQQGVNAYAPVAAANAGSMAQLGMNEVNQNIGLENQYRAQKQQYADRQMLGEVGAQNDTRSNVNQLIAGAGSTLSGGIASQGNIESNRLNSLRNNNFQQTANTVNWRQAKNDAWSNIIGNTAARAQTATNYGLFNQQAPPIRDAVNVQPLPRSLNPETAYLGLNGTYPGAESPNPYNIGRLTPPPPPYRQIGVPLANPLPWGPTQSFPPNAIYPSGFVRDPNTGNWIPG